MDREVSAATRGEHGGGIAISLAPTLLTMRMRWPQRRRISASRFNPPFVPGPSAVLIACDAASIVTARTKPSDQARIRGFDASITVRPARARHSHPPII
jgi:hypothetical protein